MSYSLEGHNEFPSKIIYLDSRDASVYLSTNSNGDDLSSYFQYQLAEQIVIPDEMNCLISLNGATIPYSFYNIREGVNDKVDFIVCENGTLNTGSATLQIPAGNYSAISLGNYLEANIPNQVFTGTTYSFNFTADYQSDSQKFQFNIAGTGVDAGKVLYIQLLFSSGENASSHARIELGFKERDVLIVAGSSADTRISDNVVDINGSIHGVYIRTNLVSTGTLDSQNGTFSNILARIPIKVQSGGIIFSEAQNNTHKSLVDLNHIGVLTIRLTDERNRILDLNGLHFQLGIQIDFIKKIEPIQLETKESRRVAEESKEVNEYKLVSDTSSGKVVEMSQIIRQQAEQLNRYKNRNKVGRPRNVGRPKGTTKINEP